MNTARTRTLSAIAACAAVAIVAAGCGGDDDDTQVSTQPAVTAVAGDAARRQWARQPRRQPTS